MLLRSLVQQSTHGSHVFHHSGLAGNAAETKGSQSNPQLKFVPQNNFHHRAQVAVPPDRAKRLTIHKGWKSSPLYVPSWSPQILTSCFRCGRGGQGLETGRVDSVGNMVWYYPVALALHSCMVPIGVPASMRTRTQTVNHLCIFLK